MTRARWSGLVALAGAAGLAFRLDEPPPEPVALEVRAEDTVVPLVRPPDTALVTPASGAPIVVVPAASFWVDMVLRIPLTPPPGIQQERALNSFAAVATGFADIGERPVVPLPITKIRPGGQSTLYRAIVEVPGWMPEGVYDLAVSGRGFEHEVERALLVRRGKIGVVTSTAAELAERARAATLSGALVALVPAGIATAEPAEEAHVRFVDALRGVGLATVVRPSAIDLAQGAASFLRRIGPLSARGPASAVGAWTDREGARDVTIADVALDDGFVVNRGAAAARVTLRVATSSPAHLELDGHRAAPRTVELAGTLAEPTVVRGYVLDVPAGARLRAALSPVTATAAATQDIALELPVRVDVGDAVTLRPSQRGPRPSADAWSFGDESFAAGERVRHRFTRLGRHDIELVRASPDGTVTRGHGRIRVDTAVRSGCSAAGGRPSTPILPWVAFLWLIWVLRSRGNCTPAPERSRVRSTIR